MTFAIAICAADSALRAQLKRHCEDYFARRAAWNCAVTLADSPGALLALVAWMLLSIGFSFYVENFANYSVIYGTLGAVIVLLVWLFLSAATLIMGAEVNGMIREWHQNRHFRPEEGGYDRV